MARAFLHKSPLYFDTEGLSLIICEVDDALSSSGVALTPQKKAQIIIMIYRAFKSSGAVDKKMIRDAIDLAAL